ncbi:MAG: hypothetical protein Q7S65_05995 [Nanoarchaeota archaeon]|nr:hypothetical protein [Nanoarchaeota archaeon]
MSGGHGKKARNAGTTLDDIVGGVKEGHKRFLEDTSPEKLDDYQANIITPPLKDFYNTLVAEIEKRFEDGTKHITKKDEKKLREAAVIAFKEFFKKARPETLEAIAGIKDLDEQYETLSNAYNSMIGIPARTQGGDVGGIDDILKSYVGNKKMKINAIKNELYALGPQHAQFARQHLESLSYTVNLSTKNTVALAHYLRKEAGKKGYEVGDHGQFMAQTHQQFPGLIRGLETGNFGTKGHEGYHLQKKGEGGTIHHMSDHQHRHAA